MPTTSHAATRPRNASTCKILVAVAPWDAKAYIAETTAIDDLAAAGAELECLSSGEGASGWRMRAHRALGLPMRANAVGRHPAGGPIATIVDIEEFPDPRVWVGEARNARARGGWMVLSGRGDPDRVCGTLAQFGIEAELKVA